MKIRTPATINDRSSSIAFGEKLLTSGAQAIAVTIRRAVGSTPRDAHAFMIVSKTGFCGTVGGGQLEWIALEEARKLLADTTDVAQERSIPLGPEIGQCCGGRVELSFERLSPEVFAELVAHEDAADRPHVQIHGAGHTGKALAKALCLLPFNVSLVDSRPDQLADVNASTHIVSTVIPEQQVREAPPRTAFIILTHAHDLDFLLAAEALSRGDASYVGMIGSKTKRAVFAKWLEESGHKRKLAEKLVCPIGVNALNNPVKDKRPEVIAALVAAELLVLFSQGK